MIQDFINGIKDCFSWMEGMHGKGLGFILILIAVGVCLVVILYSFNVIK